MMKRIKAVEGDIVLIPTKSGEYGVAKILYVPQVFRNVILLGIYQAATTNVEAPFNLPEQFAVPCIYTGSQTIKLGEWPVVARTRVADHEKDLSRRIVGGHVWLGDECVREASPDDRDRLPPMGVAHRSLVEECVESVVASIRDGGS
jgi:hypothetical protein